MTSDLDGFTVHRSLARVVTIGGKSYRLTAEDWQDIAQAEEAASLCAILVNSAGFHLSGSTATGLESGLGKYARARLNVDDSRPYGFSIVVEPIDGAGHMNYLTDAIALQALYQAYIRWVTRLAPDFQPFTRREFARTLVATRDSLPSAIPVLWR
jgi:hypothetical protein